MRRRRLEMLLNYDIWLAAGVHSDESNQRPLIPIPGRTWGIGHELATLVPRYVEDVLSRSGILRKSSHPPTFPCWRLIKTRIPYVRCVYSTVSPGPRSIHISSSSPLPLFPPFNFCTSAHTIYVPATSKISTLPRPSSQLLTSSASVTVSNHLSGFCFGESSLQLRV
jgi:hypothetical protein